MLDSPLRARSQKNKIKKTHAQKSAGLHDKNKHMSKKNEK